MNFKKEISAIKASMESSVLLREPEPDLSMVSYEDLKYCAELNRSLRYRESGSTLPVDADGNYILSAEQEARYIEIMESYGL